MRAQRWYNGDQPRNLSGYINDRTNRLIGWPMIRQIRIQNESCATTLSKECRDDFKWSNEEKRAFGPGWNLSSDSGVNVSAQIRKAFVYQSGDQLDSYIYVAPHHSYSSGGYVYECHGPLAQIQSNLSTLQQLSWIDGQTRAVFIQLSLYNPNVQLFTAVIMLIELLPTGGVFPHFRFEPISFLGQFSLSSCRSSHCQSFDFSLQFSLSTDLRCVLHVFHRLLHGHRIPSPDALEMVVLPFVLVLH